VADREWDFLYWDEDTDFEDDWTGSEPKWNSDKGQTVED